jgi:molecular chaperone GrpE
MADGDEFDSLSSAPVPGIDEAPPDGHAPGGAPADATGASLRDQLAAANAQVEEQRSLYLRALADAENFRRRVERESAARAEGGRRKLLLRVLEILDNFERAAAYRESGTPPEQLVDGLLATVKQFSTLLENEGVRHIEVAGKPFDPKVAEAVGSRAAPEVPANTVLDEARKGYVIGDELLRPAQVIVSTPSE